MEKITSFTIDHLKLMAGVYVSRIDYVEGHPITTFDLRMTSPNDEPVMNTAEMHTIEHLAATFLRNHSEFGTNNLLWSYGMPHWFLPSSFRRIQFTRHSSINERNVYIYRKF